MWPDVHHWKVVGGHGYNQPTKMISGQEYFSPCSRKIPLFLQHFITKISTWLIPAPQKKRSPKCEKNKLKRHLVWLGLQVLRGKISPKTPPRLQFGERGVIFLGGFFFSQTASFFPQSFFFCWIFVDVQKIRKANNFSYILVRLVFRIKLHGTNH